VVWKKPKKREKIAVQFRVPSISVFMKAMIPAHTVQGLLIYFPHTLFSGNEREASVGTSLADCQ
jgi:hypothetical protein